MEFRLVKTLLYSAVIVLSILAALEGIARIVYSPRDRTVYEEYQQLISVLGLPEFNETMTFDPLLFWKLRPGLDKLRVQGRVKEKRVDFTVSTNSFGLRSPEIEAKQGRFRILAIGDSCTFGLGVDDHETWPAKLEQLLNQRFSGGVEVINAGVPGYSSYQGRRFLKTAGLDLQPDLVIVSFGFNDADVWSSRTDLATARLLRMRQQLDRGAAMLQRSRFYQALTHLLRSHRAEPHENGEKKAGTGVAGSPRVPAKRFYQNLVEIQDLCAVRGIPVVFLIWPYRVQLQNDDPEFKIYQPLIARAGRETSSPVVDLFDAFRSALEEGGEDPFIDHVHASPAGCLAAATEIAEVVGGIQERAPEAQR
jgi:lysophospholipase L1-like esterase